jgi:hypothetical protein
MMEEEDDDEAIATSSLEADTIAFFLGGMVE